MACNSTARTSLVAWKLQRSSNRLVSGRLVDVANFLVAAGDVGSESAGRGVRRETSSESGEIAHSSDRRRDSGR